MPIHGKLLLRVVPLWGVAWGSGSTHLDIDGSYHYPWLLDFNYFFLDVANALQRDSDPEVHFLDIEEDHFVVSLIRLHMALTAQGGGETPQRDHGLRTEGSGPSPPTSKRLACQIQHPCLEIGGELTPT